MIPIHKTAIRFTELYLLCLGYTIYERVTIYDNVVAVQAAMKHTEQVLELEDQLRLDPVSYTHLDVYKRQLLSGSMKSRVV